MTKPMKTKPMKWQCPSIKRISQAVKETLSPNLSFLGNRKQWMKGILWFMAIFALMAWLKDHVCLLYSSTGSLPYRTYLKLKQLSPQKGNYTCIDSPWYGGPVIKEIVGVGGDVITYDNQGNLWIGRQVRVGKPKKKAKDGRPLKPLKSGTIPPGMVFVRGRHERSFDSRYEEFGLVREQDLQGRVIAIL